MFHTNDEIEDAKRILRLLREAQNNICAVAFDLDDYSKLNEALTLIGDTMDSISREYGLPIMSEQ